MNPEDELDMKNFYDEIEDEEDEDPNYFLDEIGKDGRLMSSEEQMRKKQQQKVMARLRKIEDMQVHTIVKALETGVRLEDSEVYKSMIRKFPHYKQIRDKREASILKVREAIQRLKESNNIKPEIQVKYSFEKFAKSRRRNLTQTPFDPDETLKGPIVETDLVPSHLDPEI